jgi:GT2 family glycosyltransferase
VTTQTGDVRSVAITRRIGPTAHDPVGAGRYATEMAEQSTPISVVVPFFQGERYLPALVSTLRAQGNVEAVFVVDGGAGLAAVREAASALPDAKVVSTPTPLGTAGARNVGADAATRHWITFLDQDDALPAGMLAELIADDTDRVIAYDNDLFDEVEGALRPAGLTVFEKAAWTRDVISRDAAELLLDGFPMVKLVLPRGWFRDVGCFDASVFAVEDFDLVWRLLSAGHMMTFSRAPRGRYVVRPGSITGRIARGDADLTWRAQRSWLHVWAHFAARGEFSARVRLGAARKALRAVRRLVGLSVRRLCR